MKGREGETADERFMRRALRLAERGLGETNPNPAVGCVLVLRGRVVGEGFHARAGSPHAEAMALAKAGERARGATAYVTLEPCAPHRAKRTPPCAQRLVAAGVRRVVYGVSDFNPHVRGEGAKILRQAGIEVAQTRSPLAASTLVQHFNTAMAAGRPFVTLKAGMTLDGRIATASGQSQWITSDKQRAAARRLRRLFDGVLVGVETAILDDPLLLPHPGTRRSFLRVVLDSRLRLPVRSRLVKSARSHPLIVICARGNRARQAALEKRGASVVPVASKQRRVSVRAALRALFSRGVRSLLVEGGSEVLGSFVRERAMDEVVIFRAPLILGGRGSRSVVGGDNPRSIGDALELARSRKEASATLRYGLASAADLEVEVYEPRPGRLPAAGRPR